MAVGVLVGWWVGMPGGRCGGLFAVLAAALGRRRREAVAAGIVEPVFEVCAVFDVAALAAQGVGDEEEENDISEYGKHGGGGVWVCGEDTAFGAHLQAAAGFFSGGGCGGRMQEAPQPGERLRRGITDVIWNSKKRCARVGIPLTLIRVQR